MKYVLSDDTWDIKEREALQRVIDSNRFTMGEEVFSFEQEFAEKVGKKYAVMVNSGSSANLLAVAALFYHGKLQKGDEVIVPAVSWSTTYYPFLQYGLKLKFVDIDLETLNYSIKKLERAVTKDTKCICVVNLLGNPNEWDKIIQIANTHNLVLFEDNCESLGGKFQNKELGTFGEIGTYSTFYSHHICTMEGGVAVTDNEELYHLMLSIRAHGWTRNLPEKSSLHEKKANDFYEMFNFIVPGYNLRPLEMEGALGKEQLKKMDRFIINRRKNANYFTLRMQNFQDVAIIQKEIGESSWFGFSIILKGELEGKRDEICHRLKNVGIEVRPIVTGNFTRNRVIEHFDYSIPEKLENADYLHLNGFFIGNHSIEINEEIDFFVEEFKKAMGNV